MRLDGFWRLWPHLLLPRSRFPLRGIHDPVLPGAIVELPGDSRYATGETIVAGNVIHSGGFETLLMRLEDGTEVEMRAQTEIVLEPAEDGARIRLNNGSIVVSAAKQPDGHLYVQTKDTVVSVVGRCFSSSPCRRVQELLSLKAKSRSALERRFKSS